TATVAGNARTAGNWVQQYVLRTLNEKDIAIDAYPVSAKELGRLIEMVVAGKLDTTRGRDVLGEMVDSGCSVDEAIKARGIEEVDESTLVDLCRELLSKNPKVVDDLKEGKQKAVGALIGQAKKQNPNVNPGRVREICIELVNEM
ncbi:Aspartyl/glutamyl-tRNA(Asn/Gln) amidotransferase subunit B (Asp/Glu-ADT subunit B), partial [Durusdinium trenchii]